MRSVDPDPRDPPFTATSYRQAMGAFATGVTVITSYGPRERCAMTANAVTSLSLEPPLVLVCIRFGSPMCDSIATNGSFAINILAADQEPLSRRFASPDRPRADATFDGVPWTPAATGSPILAGVAGHLDCRLATMERAGDHMIVIGRVIDLGVRHAHPPLVFVHGRYATLTEPVERAA